MDSVAYKASDVAGGLENFAGQTPGFKAGGMPDPVAQAQAKAQNPDAWAAMETRSTLHQPSFKATNPLSLFGTKNIFTGYLGNYFNAFWTTYPYSTVGKLYFTDGYSLYSCTATLIGEWTLVTAAHCAYNTDYNFWYYNWQFVPAEVDGYEPWGYWSGYSATVLTKYVSAKKATSAMRYDVAVIETYGTPGLTAGWSGWSYNFSAKQEIHAIGYPSNITGGYYTYICAAESYQKSSDVLAMGCDMTYGSSGGPWYLWFMPYQDSYPYTAYGNYVNGVVSGGTPGIPTFYGPRFSKSNILLLCSATGCY
jgi:V8-like Glu-specific endopeptidase